MKHLKSLREFVTELDSIGDLQKISMEVDLDLEIGAVCRRCYETGAPAPLFENIKGIEKGFRVLGAPGGVNARPDLSLARIALAMGLPPDTGGRAIIESLIQARRRKSIPPKLVSSGPVKQNVLTGDRVDLLRLPAPLLHDGDGGRYLNTFGVVVAQTPDKRWCNWSIARIMVLDKNRMAGIIAPNQHIGMVRQQWTELGKDMPFALVLGAEPFVPFVGGIPLPEYFNESDFVGAYFGETVDLEVPASAEIIIEGYVSHTETAPEGPMGEYAGYLWTGGASLKPVYRASAMTFRNNPILPISVAGEPVEENHTAWGIPNAAEIVHVLREAGLTIASAWSPFESVNHWYVIAAELDWRQKLGYGAEELCRNIGDSLFKVKAGMGTPEYIVVNDDVDLTDIKKVVWAFATRNHPGPRGEVVFNDETTNPLVAFLSGDEKMSTHTTKVVYNCLPHDEWNSQLPKRSSFREAYPQWLQTRVVQNWSRYGFQ